MSMRDYAIDDYGLILNEKEIKLIASKLLKDFDENMDYIELAYELFSNGILEYVSEFTGEAIEVDNVGMYSWYGNDEMYNNDVIVYVQLSRYPTLFKSAYNNMEEIIDEVKSKIGKYLPEDFNYRDKIRHICGTYYG